MNQVWTRDELQTAGYGSGALIRLGKRKELYRLRRGRFVAEPEAIPEDFQRQLIDAVMSKLDSAVVLSHASAGLIHGLPTWSRLLDRVWVTRGIGGHGRRLPGAHLRYCQLPDDHVIERDGHRLTSLERTATDLARLLEYEQAVALFDAALTSGVDRERLAALLDWQRRWPGAKQALRALEFALPGPGSVMESISRVRMAASGIPTPVVQFPVYSRHGVLVATSDFGWPDYGVVGEYDGETKYGVLLKPGQTAADAVLTEKRREDRIRDAGWWIVRWGKRDLDDQQAFADRIWGALRRGGRQPDDR